MRKTAFTLIEVLIAVAIVGIIAVLTIPALLGDINSKSNVAILKTTYKQVGDAISKAMIDQGVRNVENLEFSGSNNTEQLAAFASQYLDVARSCGNSESRCFSSSVKSYFGDSVSSPFSNGENNPDVYMTLSNGAAIALHIDLAAQSADSMYLLIDVNGVKKPNAYGIDFFAVSINRDGSLGLADGVSSDSLGDAKSACEQTTDASSAEACFELLKAKNWDIENYMN